MESEVCDWEVEQNKESGREILTYSPLFKTTHSPLTDSQIDRETE